MIIDEKRQEIHEAIGNVKSKYTIVDKEEFDVDQYVIDLLKASLSIDYHNGAFRCYNLLAAHYIILNREQDAYRMLEKSRHIVDSGYIEEFYYGALANIYIMYFHELIGDVNTAIEYYQWGIKYAEQAPDKFDAMNLKGNYAELCITKGLYEEGIEILQASNIYLKENGHEQYIMFHCVIIGDGYLGLNDYDTAMKHYEEGYALAVHNKNHQVEIASAIGKAKVMIARNQEDAAIDYLSKEINKINVGRSGTEDIGMAIMLAGLYEEKKAYDKAYPVLNQFEEQMAQCLNDNLRQPFYELLSSIKEYQCNYDEALVYEKMAHASQLAILTRKNKRS